MKNCREFTGLFGAYVYGDLALDEMRKVRLHAEGCELCRKEIETRSKAVSLIPSELPSLTDDERIRIMWSVKGAIKAKEESVRSGISIRKFVWGFAAVSMVVAAFAGGTIIGLKQNSGKQKVIVKKIPVKVNSAPAPAEEDKTAARPEASSIGPAIIPKELFASEPPAPDRIQPIFRHGKPRNNPVDAGEKTLKIDPLGSYGIELEKDNTQGLPSNSSELFMAPIPETPDSADLGQLGDAKPAKDEPAEDAEHP